LSLPLALFEPWVTCIISFISRKLFLKANHFAFSFFPGHLIGCFRELAFIFLFIFKSVVSRFFVGAGPAHNSFSCCGHFCLRLPPLSAFLPASGGSSVSPPANNFLLAKFSWHKSCLLSQTIDLLFKFSPFVLLMQAYVVCCWVSSSRESVAQSVVSFAR